MKKIFYFLAIITAFTFTACSKEKTSANNSTTATVRYDFTTDKAGNFNVEYSTDSVQNAETVTGLTWSKTVTINKQNPETVSFTVHPPFEWTTTADRANVTIKIIVDGVEKSSNTALMGGIDHPAGLTATTSF